MKLFYIYILIGILVLAQVWAFWLFYNLESAFLAHVVRRHRHNKTSTRRKRTTTVDRSTMGPYSVKGTEGDGAIQNLK